MAIAQRPTDKRRQENERAARARTRGEDNARQIANATAAANSIEQRRLNSLRNRSDIRAVLDEGPTASAEQRYAANFARYLRTGQPVGLHDLERRDMGEAGTAGYLVPKGFYRDGMLAEAKTQPFPLLANARLIETPTSSAPMNLPILQDGSVSQGALAENSVSSESDVTLGNIAYGECPFYVTGAMRYSFALSEDLDPDYLNDVIGEAWSLRTFAALEVDCTTALGGCAAYTTAVAATLSYVDLVGAFFSVASLYRGNPSACFVVSTSALKVLFNLVDATTNRPVLQNLPTRTVTDTFGDVTQTSLAFYLFGLRVFESNAFSAMAAGATVGWVGDPSHALAVRRGPASLQVLNERYVDYAQRAAIGRQAWDPQLGIAAAGSRIVLHA